MAAVLAGAAVEAGCTQQAPSGNGVHPPATVSEPSGGTTVPTPASPSPDAPDAPDVLEVEVEVRYSVPPDEASRTLVAFIRAHAESVISGEEAPGLAQLTTQTEYRRQLISLRFADRRGYVVPTRPRIAIVSRQSREFGQVLGVCLWLPSTEFVDAHTGQSPSGPVPREWAPALATLREQTVTWKVDKLSSPAGSSRISCGGLS